MDPATLGLFPGGLDANFVRVIWQQMLRAVQALHDERVGVACFVRLLLIRRRFNVMGAFYIDDYSKPASSATTALR